MQLVYTGEAEWCPEASSRGDAKQPKRRAGRRSGAHTGEGGGGGAPTDVGVLRWGLGVYGFEMRWRGSYSRLCEGKTPVEPVLPSGLHRPPPGL
jgi:hypothetical protein